MARSLTICTGGQDLMDKYDCELTKDPGLPTAIERHKQSFIATQQLKMELCDSGVKEPDAYCGEPAPFSWEGYWLSFLYLQVSLCSLRSRSQRTKQGRETEIKAVAILPYLWYNTDRADLTSHTHQPRPEKGAKS